MPNKIIESPYRKLIWRLITFSARTQISFTVREGSIFLEDGARYVELFLDGRSMDRPKTVIVPGPLTKIGKPVARVFLPEWITEPEYYPILEKYLAKIFMLGYIPERFIPILSLPQPLYDEFLKQNHLALDSSWKKRKRKALVLYELYADKGSTRLRLHDGSKVLFDFIVHLERRRDV